MPRGFLAARIDDDNPLHHLWCNNGSWWVHYTLHFDCRARRIRRSLQTADVHVAIARRDALLARLASEGEDVPERAPCRRHDAALPVHPWGRSPRGTGAERPAAAARSAAAATIRRSFLGDGRGDSRPAAISQ